MYRTTIFFAAAVAAQSLVADEMRLPILNVERQVYTNVVIFGANATDLYFSYDQGLANVKLKYLGPEIQKRFGYDPVKAANAERQRLEEEKRFGDALAKRLQAEREQAELARRAQAQEPLGENSLADAVSGTSILNKPMPELVVQKWLTAKPAVQGKFIAVFFWTTSSAPCRRCIPELNALNKKFADKLAIIAISAESEKDVAQKSDPAVDFAVAVDSESKFANAVGITDVPQILLVDPNGIIRYRGHPAALNEKVLQELFSLFPA